VPKGILGGGEPPQMAEGKRHLPWCITAIFVKSKFYVSCFFKINIDAIVTCSGWPFNNETCTHLFYVCTDVVDGEAPLEQFLIIKVCQNLALYFFSFYVFGEPEVHFRNFLLCCPSHWSARSQVPSQVATHQEIGSQLWAGETPDLNPGLQDNSLARVH
jgi:hypothetical protein